MPDSRFDRLRTDPRFRKPHKKKSRVVVDDRFKSLLSSNGKGNSVDKYGRKVSVKADRDNLKRFYNIEDSGETPRPDYARGEVLLESSDEEQEDEESSSDSDGVVTLHGGLSHPSYSHDSEPEVDLDENELADLDAQAAAYSQSHPDDTQPVVDPTYRIAAVNLDWDHVRASHLFKICSSVVSPNVAGTKRSSRVQGPFGRVLNVRVYPSAFGKERLAKEEKEGPPPEIFKRRKQKDEDVNEVTIYDVGGEEDVDEDALRNYQLERLRYYFAVITCDNPETASHLFSELEGTELERSANVFDLSFVPDEMTFEDSWRDEATDVSDHGFKGVDFTTDALRHSKVKLTWDDDDAERNHLTRRALTKKDIEENDFSAYVASSSDDEDDQEEPQEGRASREHLRSLLLGGNDEDLPEGWSNGQGEDREDDIDMEVTFAPGLSSSIQEESTLDVYKRKMKEKRKRKKEERTSAQTPVDDFFESADSQSSENEGDLSLIRHEDSKVDLDERASSLHAEPDHFDLKAVMKAEKLGKSKAKRQKKRVKNIQNLHEVQENFKIDVTDNRFTAVHEDHAFAIDPSNPHFKRTKAMADLLDERSKRQRARHDDYSPGKDRKSGKDLVQTAKRKSSSKEQRMSVKRRRT